MRSNTLTGPTLCWDSLRHSANGEMIASDDNCCDQINQRYLVAIRIGHLILEILERACPSIVGPPRANAIPMLLR